MRFGRRGGAADDASLDAVENGREPEEVEREIKAEVGNGAASRPRAIGGDILVLGRNAERVRIGATKPRDDVPPHPVAHRMTGKTRERMPARPKQIGRAAERERER